LFEGHLSSVDVDTLCNWFYYIPNQPGFDKTDKDDLPWFDIGEFADCFGSQFHTISGVLLSAADAVGIAFSLGPKGSAWP
jgi:hypothetical protein